VEFEINGRLSLNKESQIVEFDDKAESCVLFELFELTKLKVEIILMKFLNLLKNYVGGKKMVGIVLLFVIRFIIGWI